jgi:hypothetical protein
LASVWLLLLEDGRQLDDVFQAEALSAGLGVFIVMASQGLRGMICSFTAC